MARPTLSTKRLQINRANSTVVIAAGLAAFITVFCIIATKTLAGQAAYQNKVIGRKKDALTQLKADITATTSLKQSYTKFDGASTNIIGGSAGGNGPQDGSNSQIVLNALPSSYDFPALATSLEKLVTSQNLTISAITGTDDSLTMSSKTSTGQPTPQPIPFQVAVTGDYGGVQNLVKTFERSIRPIQINNLNLSGTQDNLALAVNASTYYQTAKTLNIQEETVTK